LHDKEYVDLVKTVIRETLERYNCESSTESRIDDQMLFEMLKLEIRSKTIQFGARKKRQMQQKECELEKEIANLFDTLCECTGSVPQCMDVIEKKQQELEEIRNVKTRAAMLRAKVQHYELGEKPTRFFFNLEKRNGNAKTLTQLNVNGTLIMEPGEILNVQRDYYEQLYAPVSVIDEECSDTFFQDDCINELNDIQKEFCEGQISEKDVKTALSAMSNNKSPGSDGFTVEFYKFFYNDIGEYLLKSYNHAFSSGALSVTQRLGVITCLPKPNKDRELIKNWRPISLLNVDYKILSNVLASRLKEVLCDVINLEQKGFLKNRCLSENCRYLYDVMFELEKKNKPGLLLLVDFEKAFDSISWEYMKKVLEKYNFGDNFRKWFSILYNESKSVVINGGYFSEAFKLGRGCRQGDPLSCYLFLLAIEPLAMKIKSDSEIKGIKLGSKEHKLGQYADDLFMFQDGSKASLEYTFHVFKLFERASGLKVNVEKTHAVWIGSKIGSNDTVSNRIRLKWTDNFVLLGIHFNVDLSIMTETNYNVAIGKMENVLSLYKKVPLSLMGKITVVKSLMIPKLVHIMQVLPQPCKKHIEYINSLVRNFIWNGKKARISLRQLMLDYEDGGLKLTDIVSLNTAIKISWIKRLCTTEGGFQDLFECTISDMKEHVWYLDQTSMAKQVKNTTNPFWKEVFNAWLKYCKDKDRDVESYPLWNSYLTNKNVLCKRQELVRKGVVFVNDLIKQSGGMMSHKDFREHFDVNINFLDYHSLIQSMPKEWRICVRNKTKLETVKFTLLEQILSCSKVCKFVYCKMMTDTTLNTKKTTTWSEKLCVPVSDVHWKEALISLRMATVSSVLRSFQYMLLHRSVVTNSYLYKCKLKDEDKCYFCGERTETLEHLFCECVIIKKLWSDFAIALLPYIDLTMYLEPKYIMMGVGSEEHSRLMNMLFITVKRYIYVNKCKEQNIHIQGLIMYVKKYYVLETNCETSTYNIKKWSPLDDMLRSDEN